MAMDVTLRQLRAYVAVLESASFSEAAKAMHLSQAALSGLDHRIERTHAFRTEALVRIEQQDAILRDDADHHDQPHE